MRGGSNRGGEWAEERGKEKKEMRRSQRKWTESLSPSSVLEVRALSVFPRPPLLRFLSILTASLSSAVRQTDVVLRSTCRQMWKLQLLLSPPEEAG